VWSAGSLSLTSPITVTGLLSLDCTTCPGRALGTSARLNVNGYPFFIFRSFSLCDDNKQSSQMDVCFYGGNPVVRSGPRVP
jgi:hypothetical protein